MGERDPESVISTLRELSRKELVRPVRQSSMAGEAEYAFWHVLARDVAYSQLPRASRANRHVAAAAWIESKAPERVEDLADVLAFHYASALELARAAGESEQVEELEAPALRFLSLAGERALGLDTAAALASFERALALTPPGNPERAAALARFGEAAQHAGRFVEAKEALEEAITSFQAAGDLRGAAKAMGTLSSPLARLADPRGWDLPAEALALLEPLRPGPEHVIALTEAAVAVVQGRNEIGLGYAEQALALAEQLGLPRPARALGYRALARCNLGDSGGLDDFREAIALATDAGQGREVALLHNNLAMVLWPLEGPAVSLEVVRAGTAFAHSRGLTGIADTLVSSTLDMLFDTGEHEQALTVASELAVHYEASGNVLDLTAVRCVQTLILTLRGQAPQTAGTLTWLVDTTREAGQSDYVVSNLSAVAHAHAALGQDEQAAHLLAEIEVHGTRAPGYYAACLPAMVRTALALGNQELSQRLVAGLQPRSHYAEHALTAVRAALSEARRDLEAAAEAYADAAARWQSFGVVPEQAFALLGQGRCLIELGRTSEAIPVLQQAREIFQKLKADPALAEIDELLQQATALTS